VLDSGDNRGGMAGGGVAGGSSEVRVLTAGRLNASYGSLLLWVGDLASGTNNKTKEKTSAPIG